MKLTAIAAFTAAALIAAGSATAQTSGAPSTSPSRGGAASGSSTQSGLEAEIKTQLEAMGYTDVAPVKQGASGMYETKAKRNGEAVSLMIDAKSGQIREKKG